MKRIFVLLTILMLAGCASTPVTQTILTPLAPVAVPTVAPLVMNPVHFQAMNSQDVENLAAQLKQSGADNVFFMLDEQDYKNLLLNLNSINSYIAQESAVVQLLENVNADRAKETNVPTK